MGFNVLFHGSSPGCNILLATNCSCRRGWIPQMLQKVRYLLAEAPTHQDVVFFMMFPSQVGVQVHRVAGLVSSEIDKNNLTSSYIVFFKNSLKLSKPSLLNFQRHFPGEHWATSSHRGWVWHITRTWGVPSDFQESHQGVWYYLLIFAVLGKMRGFSLLSIFHKGPK